MLDKFPLDSIRYYLCASVTYGADLSFSEASLITMHNSELADILGNLVHRVLNLCMKYCDGVIPDTVHDPAFSLPFDLDTVVRESCAEASACSINIALFKAMDAARATNRYLTEAEPWKMKGADESRRPAIVRTTLEALYAFMHLLAPVLPMAAQAVFERLSTPPVPVKTLKADFYNLTPGSKVSIGDILFQKIEAEDLTAKAEIKPVVKAAKKEVVVEDPNQVDFTKMDFRVGVITKVWHHETAERLFCEEIDVGEEAPRPIASGLRQYYSLEEMQGRRVVVVCNLKESKLQGFISCGMVLAAKTGAENDSKIVLLEPPANAAIGDRVYVEGLQEGEIGGGPPATPAKVKKLKLWEAIAVDLSTDNDCVACWKGRPLLVGGVSLIAPLASSAPIS